MEAEKFDVMDEGDWVKFGMNEALAAMIESEDGKEETE